MTERIVTNVELEFIGTPLTHEILRAEGFLYKLEQLSPDEIEKASDPFYYFKGEFRVYDVMDDFYVKTPGMVGAGVRVQSLEALQEAYIDFMGRKYTKDVLIEDTAVPEYDKHTQGVKLGSEYTKIKLVGGPGEGLTIIWPVFATFFVYQTEKIVNGKKIKEGWQYQKRKGRKTLYDYVGPVD